MNDSPIQETKNKIRKFLEAEKIVLEKKYPDEEKRPKG